MRKDPEEWLEEHVCEDQKKPYYRECHNCGHAFRKDEKAFRAMDRTYYCNANCVYEYEEGLRAQNQERLLQAGR